VLWVSEVKDAEEANARLEEKLEVNVG